MSTIDSLPTRDPWASEGHHDFYKVSVRVESDLQGSLRLDCPEILAHPIPNGPHLQSYVRLTQSQTLRVVFHGAVRAGIDQYPRFDRVTTMLRTNDSFLSIADPTLVLDPEMTLGWYIGSREWDPDETIISLIREALLISGSTNLIFVGGSGGGFAALKYSRFFPGSLAFVFSPQTDVARYRGGSFPRLLKSGFQDMSEDEVKSIYPGRFDVLEGYGHEVQNKVYYYQNLTDPAHITDHYLPFLRQVRIDDAMGDNSGGNIRAVLVPQQRDGHGPPTAQEFDKHLAEALKFHQEGGGPKGDGADRRLDDLVGQVSSLQDRLEDSIAANGRTYRALSRELGILPWSITTYSRLVTSLIPEDSPLPPAGSYAVRALGAAEIVRLTRDSKPKSVVECGSGSSTVWIASVLEQCRRGHIFSLEHDPYYARETRRLLESLGLGHRATVLDAPLQERVAADGLTTNWYSDNAVQQLPVQIDVLFVDGPPSTTGKRVRRSAWECLQDRMVSGGFIAIDDARRPEEAAMLREWEEDPRLQSLEGFNELVVMSVSKKGNNND